MRSIQPIFWKRNSPHAEKLSIQLVYDNLSTTCTTCWQVLTAESIVIDSGNISITGEDYASWDGSNDFVYQYIANQLNVILIQDYGAGLGTENL